MTAPNYLTAAQAAEILHVTPWRITEACRSGELPAYKPGKAWLIHPDDIAPYVKRKDAERRATEQGDAA